MKDLLENYEAKLATYHYMRGLAHTRDEITVSERTLARDELKAEQARERLMSAIEEGDYRYVEGTQMWEDLSELQKKIKQARGE